MGTKFAKISYGKLNSTVRNFRKHRQFPKNSLACISSADVSMWTEITRYTVVKIESLRLIALSPFHKYDYYLCHSLRKLLLSSREILK